MLQATLTFIIAGLWLLLLECGPDDSAWQDRKWREVGRWVR